MTEPEFPGDEGALVPQFDTVADAADFYEQQVGWQVTVAREKIWLAHRYEIDAISMPESLGQLVLDRLYKRCPVFRSSGPPPRWVFLTLPLNALRDQWLVPATVSHLWGTEFIWLPPSQWGEQPLEWITPPTSPLSSFAVLAGVIDRAIADHSG
ncbi:hypothetical protein [Amycolatopsis sp. NPDC059657]|uniref:hypothetical protein n=1 Tax=Amycolatopsis sp. NPDC059657 TaxID=3346899 RepID=UPI00366FF798